MDALIQQESGGRGTAVGPQTQYGQALGSTQMLPSTARQMAQKLGLRFDPALLRSNRPDALQYQRRLGEAYLKEGLEKTGNVQDALHYYHGGPNRKLWGPKTRSYANSVLSRLR
jgi:soluble lytic murein transglycosylase-like protein